VKHLERLAVHVEEAIRLGTASDEAHLRLGLILLDSAAELLMHRQCEQLLAWNSYYGHLLKSMEEMPDQVRDETYEARITDLRSNAVSNTRRKKINKEFDAKCDFLSEKDLLAEPHVRVLKRLHDYRNETYHRDEVRSGTLASAAKIYIYLVCTMMRDFPDHSMFIPLYSASDITPILAKYIDTNTDGILDRDLQRTITEQLMEESAVGEPKQLGRALAQHVKDRLGDLEKSAADTIDWFQAVTRDETWDIEASLRMAQATDQMDAVHTADHARALNVPIGLKQVEDWRRRSEKLQSETNDLDAFAMFADLEEAFEPVEALVSAQAMTIDREIQLQMDIARGK
jgi:hypothetical protein